MKNSVDGVVFGKEKEIARINSLSQIEDKEEHDDFREPLCVDTDIIKDIVLSTGGPADGFKLYFTSDMELYKGVYYRADWDTYNESELTEEEAQKVFDFYLGGEVY